MNLSIIEFNSQKSKELVDKFLSKSELVWVNETIGDGENIVKEVGLFDEYFYPIYFEDNDYYERVIRSSFKNNYISGTIKVNAPHGASQTIHSDERLRNKNNETFLKNKDYFIEKQGSNFLHSKGWSLDKRRDHEWLR